MGRVVKKKEEYASVYGEIPDIEDERVCYILEHVKNKETVKEKAKEGMDRLQNMKWETIRFTMYLVPKGTPRPRKGLYGNFYVAGAAENKKMFQEFYEQNNLPYITTACKVYLKSYLPTPSAMCAPEKILAELGLVRPITKPDFDNLIKAYVDMMQDTLLLDDAFVIEGISKKYYSIKPRIELTIRYQVGYDSKWNSDKVSHMLSHKEKSL